MLPQSFLTSLSTEDILLKNWENRLGDGLRCRLLFTPPLVCSTFYVAEARVEAQPVNEKAKTDSSKVPAVTLTFWIIKILATTLGETGGDAVW